MEHTPGPWRVVSWGDRFSVAETQDNDRHPFICDVSGPNCWPNAKANAMAIAALSEIESVSTDQHAVGIAKAALANVEE